MLNLFCIVRTKKNQKQVADAHGVTAAQVLLTLCGQIKLHPQKQTKKFIEPIEKVLID